MGNQVGSVVGILERGRMGWGREMEGGGWYKQKILSLVGTLYKGIRARYRHCIIRYTELLQLLLPHWHCSPLSESQFIVHMTLGTPKKVRVTGV